MTPPQLSKIIRLLSSPIEGEIIAAAAALNRMLASNNLDIHDIADAAVAGLQEKPVTKVEPSPVQARRPDRRLRMGEYITCDEAEGVFRPCHCGSKHFLVIEGAGHTLRAASLSRLRFPRPLARQTLFRTKHMNIHLETPHASGPVLRQSPKHTNLDAEQPRQFLKLLDPTAAGFTFQTFSDNKSNKNPELTQIVQSPAHKELLQLHAHGAGVYVTINETDGKGRKSENITRIRAVFQEDDDGFDGEFPLAPSIINETSPGHFHRTWLIDGDWPADEQGRADFAAVMERMVESYGSDKNAKDISRVLRVPGFLHRKGKPHLVRIVEANGRRYSRAGMIAAFPPVERPKTTETHSEWRARDDDEQRIRNALQSIDPNDRESWLQCGMALKHEMQEAGRPLWDDWSRQSNKYDERDQGKTWRSIKRDGIRIGTVFHLAKQAGWRDERTNRGPSNGADASWRAATQSGAEVKPEPPRPLTRELPPADPFPIDALGDLLGSAARAIHERVQCPLAICGQSVIAAATLAAQGHADVQLPTGHVRPISNFFVTIAETGERKTAADNEALWPVRKREKALREAYDEAFPSYENQRIAWEKAREHAMKKAKGDRGAIKYALDALGPAPTAPLQSMLTCPEPTYQGLCKYFPSGQPSVGVFSSEGGQFIGGHGMSEDNKLLTASSLSSLWDGEPIKRVRAGDGTLVLPGRRTAMHLMAQPDVAAIMLSDRMLLSQGLLSRCLITAPESISGTRAWREPSDSADAVIKRYGARILALLEHPLPLADGKTNELAPRVLQLASDARKIAGGQHHRHRLAGGVDRGDGEREAGDGKPTVHDHLLAQEVPTDRDFSGCMRAN
jgi:hypothetical protein